MKSTLLAHSISAAVLAVAAIGLSFATTAQADPGSMRVGYFPVHSVLAKSSLTPEQMQTDSKMAFQLDEKCRSVAKSAMTTHDMVAMPSDASAFVSSALKCDSVATIVYCSAVCRVNLGTND